MVVEDSLLEYTIVYFHVRGDSKAATYVQKDLALTIDMTIDDFMHVQQR